MSLLFFVDPGPLSHNSCRELPQTTPHYPPLVSAVTHRRGRRGNETGRIIGRLAGTKSRLASDQAVWIHLAFHRDGLLRLSLFHRFGTGSSTKARTEHDSQRNRLSRSSVSSLIWLF